MIMNTSRWWVSRMDKGVGEWAGTLKGNRNGWGKRGGGGGGGDIASQKTHTHTHKRKK